MGLPRALLPVHPGPLPLLSLLLQSGCVYFSVCVFVRMLFFVLGVFIVANQWEREVLGDFGHPGQHPSLGHDLGCLVAEGSVQLPSQCLAQEAGWSPREARSGFAREAVGESSCRESAS